MTDEQYRRLLHIISLGHRTLVEEEEKTVGVGLVDIEQYVQSFSGEFNSTDLVNYDIETGMYSHSIFLNGKTDKIIDYYKDHVFLNELTDRLTARHIKLQGKNPSEMDVEEIEKIQMSYLDEFLTNDIKNLQLIKH